MSANSPAPSNLDPFDLDLEQVTLIEAGAGTGKTYTIATLFVRLLARGYPVESILVVTFTEAAAAELKLRIRSRLSACLAALDAGQDTGRDDDLVRFLRTGPDPDSDPDLVRNRLRLALTCFDLAAVMTIHSFCFSVLRDNAFESNAYFDMELRRDSTGFLGQTAMDFFYARVINQDPLFLDCLHKAGITPERFADEFRQVVGKNTLAIVPETAVFREIWEAYRETTGQLARILAREKEGILDLIRCHKGVDKRSYSKKNLPAWLDQSQALLAGAPRVFSMAEKGDPLYKFTASRLAQKTKAGQTPPHHPFFDACEDLLGLSRDMEENLVALRLEFLAYFRETLLTLKSLEGACFFDDLINDLASALTGPEAGRLKGAVRERYHACLIDEFQDTDPGQYVIFSSLFGSPGPDRAQPPFFMIGDPKQAIYAFRGGDIFAYLNAARESSQDFTLPVNYRSAPRLVRAVNKVFSLKDAPFGFREIPFHPVITPLSARDRLTDGQAFLPPLDLVMVARDGLSLDRKGTINLRAAQAAIPGLLAGDMLAMLQPGAGAGASPGFAGGDGTPALDRAVSPGDMAVLVRTNAEAEAVQQALAAVNIPSYLSKSGSVFDSDQAVEFFDLLCAVDRPGDTGLLKAALVSSVYAFDQAMIRELDRDDQALWKWQDRFRRYHELWAEKGFVAMVTGLFHDDTLSPAPGATLSERALTNFYHLMELASQAALHRQLEPPYLIRWYQSQLRPDTREDVADELRLESDARAVAIVTIHKSKGLEYPVVFLPYLWAGQGRARSQGPAVYHDPEDNFRLCLDLGSDRMDEARALMAKEAEAEEMRLLYVALTRASAWCRVYWAGVAGAETTALGRLLHPEGMGDDPAIRADLEGLSAADPEAISVSPMFKPEEGAVYTPGAEPSADLVPKRLTRAIETAWRISSYSALVAGRHSEQGAFQAVPPEPSERSEPLPETGDSAADPDDSILLEHFPKGAGAGDFFHAVFEEIDFRYRAGVGPVVSENLDRYGFRGMGLSGIAEAAVDQILDTPLADASGELFRLSEVGMDHRFTELEFCFNLEGLDLKGMAALFGGRKEFSAYAGRLAGLGAAPFRGFLKGFIDLVVHYGDRWYILDYKSNYLGATYDDYSGPALSRAMESHDYTLQYHLYLAALDRYLRLRIKDYDHEVHFGGVFYLFIRGMRPAGDTGVYFHRPGAGFMAEFQTHL